ncbi:MAG: cellulase family glycosylhydrolase [Lentisphaeria bacterium]|nr:glycoside hydrolase family 5 protein [Lentisphaeria bacterium]NQZ70127.1 cellulase family glycosylhydrolase [Lentisphaeria bacterium]
MIKLKQHFLIIALFAGLTCSAQSEHWRGFNLTNKMHVFWANGKYDHWDFKMIHKWGFNYVRLPLDYRCWIVKDDWTKFNDRVLSDIDEAIEWALKYKIHITLNFHRAPGYTVAQPVEKTNIWKNKNTQKVCIKHWEMFAERYKDIAGDKISFNLFNEPVTNDLDSYKTVIDSLIKAIRAIDDDRLIMLDGLNYGKDPVLAAEKKGIIYSTRGYSPFNFTHYKADWVKDSEHFEYPLWPQAMVNGYIIGPQKKDKKKTIQIVGEIKKDHWLTLHIKQVSVKGTLVVYADKKKVFTREIIPGKGKGEWTEEVYKKEWDVYQNKYNLFVGCRIPAGTKEITIANDAGDWILIGGIYLLRLSDDRKLFINGMNKWKDKQFYKISYLPAEEQALKSQIQYGIRDIEEYLYNPWKKVSKNHPVFVGEFGVFKKTPHGATLRWMEDHLKLFKEMKMGWAMWNFRGPFGVVDSERSDVKYKNIGGHKLDQKMLKLLQKYAKE